MKIKNDEAMKKRSKYLLKNTAIFTLSNIGTKIINFFLVPIYTYVLTVSEYGTIDLIFTVCLFAIPILILNINEAIMRFSLDKNADYNKLISIAFLCIGFSAIGGFILYKALGYYKPISPYKGFVYAYTFTFGICEIFICYLRGREQLMEFAISNILRTFFIALLNIIFLVYYKLGIKGYLYAYILGNLITSLYAFFIGKIYSSFSHFTIDKQLFKEMRKYSILLIPTSFMWWIINSSDRIMITYFIGIGESGIYAVASKIPSMISVISNIFNQAYSYSAIRENENEDKEEYNNKIFEFLFVSVTLLSLILICFIKPLMRLYVSESYYLAWLYTPPLILGTSIMVIATFFSVFYTVNKDSKGFFKSGIIGAIVNILLNLMLIPTIGVLGASIATCTSYIFVFIFRYYDTKKYIILNVFNLKTIFLLICLVISSISAYINDIFGYCINGILIISILFLYKNIWIILNEIIKVRRDKK